MIKSVTQLAPILAASVGGKPASVHKLISDPCMV